MVVDEKPFICDVDREETIEYMFKQLDKAIASKAVNCSKCIVIANARAESTVSTNIHKLSKDLTSNIKPVNQKSSANNIQEKRQKTFEFIRKTANQHGMKSELFDVSAININFNNSQKGFSSNSSEFESFLSQLLL